MPQIEKVYETVFILKSELDEDTIGVIDQKIRSIIDNFKGEVKLKDDWGVNQMAYAIDKLNTGRYIVMQYTGKAGVVEEIERHFRLSTEVMRFLTVVAEEGQDYAVVKKQIKAAEEDLKKSREARKEKETQSKGAFSRRPPRGKV